MPNMKKGHLNSKVKKKTVNAMVKNKQRLKEKQSIKNLKNTTKNTID